MDECESAQALNKMPEEYKQILVHQLLAHTEGELSGADNYRLMAPHAPNAYEMKVIYEAAADEIKHYMIGAQLLEEMNVDTRFMLRQTLAERSHYPSHFVRHPDNWAERGLSSLLEEWAALEHIREMAESSYLPLRAAFPIVVKEESGHIAHGYRIVRSLCATPEGKQQVQVALNWKWPQTLDLFGRSNSERSLKFLSYGLRKRSNEEARAKFAKEAREKLEGLGLEVPPDEANRAFL